jgi:signal transduction histidine kinase
VIQFFEWSGAGEELDRNEFLKKFVTENEINTLLCLPCEGGRLFVLGWMTGGFLSREKLSRIRSASSVFSSCLENILRYEGHKALVIEQMKLAMNELDISRLESENRELQRSYQKIRTLQNDLIKKERKAALTKFSISLDDEISAPLGNLLMAVQYQLERIEKGKGFSDEERGRILGVVVSQSLRIKNILEELRKISDSYSHYGNAGPSG